MLEARFHRPRLVFLTDLGKAVRPIASAAGRKVDERWAELTSPQEMETLRQVLRQLFDKVRDEVPARQGGDAEG